MLSLQYRTVSHILSLVEATASGNSADGRMGSYALSFARPICGMVLRSHFGVDRSNRVMHDDDIMTCTYIRGLPYLAAVKVTETCGGREASEAVRGEKGGHGTTVTGQMNQSVIERG
jgi:hypothetical protein